MRSLHHQVFLDNLHALHYIACTPKLLHCILPRNCLFKAAFSHHASSEFAGAARAQTALAFENLWSPAFNPGSSVSGCLFCALDVNHSVKEIIVVCHECKAPYLNTDMDKAVCFF